MKVFRISFIVFLLAFSLFFSCEDKSGQSDKNITFSIEIKDSVLVDFLGDYELQDFDPIADNYLLRNPQTYVNYLEVDLTGDILTEAELSREGKDAVGDIQRRCDGIFFDRKLYDV